MSEFFLDNGSYESLGSTVINARCDAYTKGRCILEAQVLWDLDLDISLDDNVVLESSILVVHFVSAMAEPTYPISFLEWLCDFTSYFFNNTSVVATDLNRIFSLFSRSRNSIGTFVRGFGLVWKGLTLAP